MHAVEPQELPMLRLISIYMNGSILVMVSRNKIVSLNSAVRENEHERISHFNLLKVGFYVAA